MASIPQIWWKTNLEIQEVQQTLGSTNKNKNTYKGISAARKMEMCFPLFPPLNINRKPGRDIKYMKNLKARKNKADRSWGLGAQEMTQ